MVIFTQMFNYTHYGPVLSTTLNFINGYIPSCEKGWEAWINDRSNHMVSLKNDKFAREDLIELSDSDIEILDGVWSEFGEMNQWEIFYYTHKLDEWEDPEGSSLPINHKDVFIALGKSEDEAEQLRDEIYSQRKLDEIFSSL